MDLIVLGRALYTVKLLATRRDCSAAVFDLSERQQSVRPTSRGPGKDEVHQCRQADGIVNQGAGGMIGDLVRFSVKWKT
jgi:hypothetical protein